MDTDETFSSASLALQGETLTIDTVRLVPVNELTSLDAQLGKYHNRKVIVAKVKRDPQNLHYLFNAANRSTVLVELIVTDVKYQPGDHVGIFPANRKDIVDGIIQHLRDVESYDEILQLQLLKENHTTNGIPLNR